MAIYDTSNTDAYTVSQDGLRLDEIVVFYYGDLTMFDAVLEANPHLGQTHIPQNTIVYMPKIDIKPAEDVLW